MSDPISRQTAHKWETCFECPLSHGCPKIKGCTNEQAIEYVSQIPRDCPLPAQPERKHGYWIESHEHAYIGNGVIEWINWYCSECDAPNDKSTDFCPSCGADMRGEKDV